VVKSQYVKPLGLKIMTKEILLKIGTNTLTKETNHISRKLRILQAAEWRIQFIIVSSGAIAAAKQFVKLESKGKEIVVKQALASIGQPHLMRIFMKTLVI
jgi:glutamate 5-kinase